MDMLVYRPREIPVELRRQRPHHGAADPHDEGDDQQRRARLRPDVLAALHERINPNVMCVVI